MRIIILPILLMVSIALTGCIEIIEDLTLNSDRSGSYKLTINLSASKMKVKSLMAMDSLRGRKIPGESDIKNELNQLVNFLNTQKGLSAAKTEINFDDLICKISLDFASVEDLQKGFHAFSAEKMEEPFEFFEIFELNKEGFKRNAISQYIEEEWVEQIDQEDMELLKESSLVLITRFDKPLSESEHACVSISKNRLAGMFRTNLVDVIEHKVTDDYKLLFANE